jgi:hypothetical protein
MYAHLGTVILVKELEHQERLARVARTRLVRSAAQSTAEPPPVAKVAWQQRARSAWASVAARVAAVAGAELRHRPLG